MGAVVARQRDTERATQRYTTHGTREWNILAIIIMEIPGFIILVF